MVMLEYEELFQVASGAESALVQDFPVTFCLLLLDPFRSATVTSREEHPAAMKEHLDAAALKGKTVIITG
jgi:hypothetical protein